MCSINGINFKDEKLIKNITNSNNFRGPDKTQIFSYENYLFGFNLLSINSNKDTGLQPKVSEKYILLFNGEIYNLKKLIEKFNLKGNFESDTDVLFSLVNSIGINFARYIDGMYSVVLFDKLKKKYFLLRDRFGTKPLYYYYNGNNFYFSSSLSSLSKNIRSLEVKINNTSLNYYLNFGYNFGESTLIKGINQVNNSQMVTFDDKNKTIKKEYFISNPPLIKDNNDFRYTIREAFESKHDLAILLSGGVDSNVLFKENIKFNKKDTTAFSTKFLDVNDKYNEDFYSAKKQSTRSNVKFEEISISYEDFLENLQDSYQALEEPILNIGIPIYYISFKYIRSKGFRSIVSGDGGDELFFGYSFQKLLYNYNKYNIFYKHIDYFQKNIFGRKKLILIFYYLFMKKYDLLFNIINNLNLLNKIDTNDIFKNFGDRKITNLKEFFEEDLNFKLSNDFVSLKDNLGMNFNLETRFPFLQASIVDYLKKVNFNTFFDKNINKKFLFNIYKNDVDNEYFLSRKKGWTIPNKWLTNSETINFCVKNLPKNYDIFLKSIGIEYNKNKFFYNIKYRTLIFSLLTWCKKNNLL